MNFGIQSILWGESKSLGDILRDIASIGYSGVELFQHPDQVGGSKRVYDLFQEHRLVLLGVTSGSLLQKLDFVEDYASRLGLPLWDFGRTFRLCFCQMQNCRKVRPKLSKIEY